MKSLEGISILALIGSCLTIQVSTLSKWRDHVLKRRNYEGSCSQKEELCDSFSFIGYVISISFITNRQKYGPFGINRNMVSDVHFSTPPGRVVGFNYNRKAGWDVLAGLQVYVLQNTVRCMQHFLSS